MFCTETVKWTEGWAALFVLPLGRASPVLAGPPLSFASSPWHCSVPAPCFAPAEPRLRFCPPRAPLSAPHVASYTPAYSTAQNETHMRLCFRCFINHPVWFTKLVRKNYTNSICELRSSRKPESKTVWQRNHVNLSELNKDPAAAALLTGSLDQRTLRFSTFTAVCKMEIWFLENSGNLLKLLSCEWITINHWNWGIAYID